MDMGISKRSFVVGVPYEDIDVIAYASTVHYYFVLGLRGVMETDLIVPYEDVVMQCSSTLFLFVTVQQCAYLC